MNSIKIIQKFYNKKDALKAASYFKNQYKKDGHKVTIEIIEAYKVHPSIKNKIGSPRPDDFMILIKKISTPIIKNFFTKVKTTLFKIIKRKPLANPKPIMKIATKNYSLTMPLVPTYNINIVPLILPFSLCSQI